MMMFFTSLPFYFFTLRKSFATMTTHTLWTDECWLPLLRLYMRRPEGVKPMFSRGMVELALELHIPPQVLYGQMFRLRRPDTPSLARLCGKYRNNPKRLARDIKTLRRMSGMGSGGGFYDGVEVNETFEKDFRPISGHPALTPAALVIVLDLYFRLTPATMVKETPEVAELARTTHTKASEIVETLDCFQACDPYLKRPTPPDSPLSAACRDVWHRYGNGEPQELAAMAAQLREYY